MSPSQRKSLMRNLGEFFGHVTRALRSDPGTRKRVLDRSIEQDERQTDGGKVTLRRTTVEEIEFEPMERRDGVG